MEMSGICWFNISLYSVNTMFMLKISSAKFCRLSCKVQSVHAKIGFYRLLSNNVDISPVNMPSLSPTMTHGTIAAWRKQPGDELKAGDVLCDIETDKASVGLEVQDNSVLAKILVDAHGSEMKVGVPIALTVEDKEAYQLFLKMDTASYLNLVSSSAAPSVSKGTSSAPAQQVTTTTSASTASSAVHKESSSDGRVKLSPAARHMVQSQSLNVSGVKGTARGGRITKGDIINAIRDGTAKSEISTKSNHSVSPATNTTPASHSQTPTPTTTANNAVNNNYTDIPASNMRKVIAKRLTESKATVPHFYTSIECEIDELMSLRKTFKKDFDVNVSVNDLVIKSAALALRDVPEVNAKYNVKTGTIIPGNGNVDISVAVATPNGLITPILTGADKRGLVDISSTVRDLAGRAREGKLKPEEYQGGSFSISNLGMFGISSFSAVINPPQACILAVGAGISKIAPPRAGSTDGKPRVVTTVTVQLSSDRRVVDEAIAAQFLQVFQKYLSSPKTIML